MYSCMYIMYESVCIWTYVYAYTYTYLYVFWIFKIEQEYPEILKSGLEFMWQISETK